VGIGSALKLAIPASDRAMWDSTPFDANSSTMASSSAIKLCVALMGSGARNAARKTNVVAKFQHQVCELSEMSHRFFCVGHVP